MQERLSIPVVGALRWAGWIVLALAGVAAGMRFFPRYYFLLLAPAVLLAARGFGRGFRLQNCAMVLLLIPLTRFGPAYLTAIRDPAWRDTAMDRDSRAAARTVSQLSELGDTLFIWGYRPEIYVYTGLPAATMFLDSQPLTGVPADRHLTRSDPLQAWDAAQRRAQLAASHPSIVVDGLGLYNPNLGNRSGPRSARLASQLSRSGARRTDDHLSPHHQLVIDPSGR